MGLNKNDKTYLICCLTNLFSAIGVVFPLLLVPLRELYGITYTQFGVLVSLNFCIQILSDVAFSRPVDKYGFKIFAIVSPLVSSISLVLFALSPLLFPSNIFLGFCFAMVLHATAAGLQELLLSPIVNSLSFPEKKKAAKMSLLHSFFAWGQIIVIPLTTLVLKYKGYEYWSRYLILLSICPLLCCFLFSTLDWSSCRVEKNTTKIKDLFKSKVFIVSVIAIILGGASEVTMSQWTSAFLDRAISIPKEFGDIFGLCGFALFLALGRTFHGIWGAKFSINKLLMVGSLCSFICYLTAALSSSAILAVAACALTGFCASLLWPGTISVVAKALPSAGASLFALMSASGDIGASFSSYLVGKIVDNISVTNLSFLGYNGETMGLRIAILVAGIFPLLSFFVQLKLKKISNTEAGNKWVKSYQNME